MQSFPRLLARACLSCAALMLLASIASAQQSEETIAFETVVKYPQSAIFEPETHVIANKSDWKQLWRRLQARNPTPDPRPFIDFQNRMLIAVFEGPRPLNVNFDIKRLVKVDGAIKVFIHEVTLQGPHCLPFPAIVWYPFHIVQAPRLEKSLRKHVEFIVEQEIKDCQ
jgi:hypothetical protein